MAQKKLSNGRYPRAYDPSPYPSGAPAFSWALSVDADPSRSFALIALDTDLQFMSLQAQRECDAWIVTCPVFLPGAQAHRLLARFEAALESAGRRARLLDSKAAFITFDDCQSAQGSALASAFVSFNYELARSFWSALTHPLDPRRARRAARLKLSPRPAPFNEPAEWEATKKSLETELKRLGFSIRPAPWILSQYAGELEGLAYRERARACLADQHLNDALRSELPAGRLTRQTSL